MNIEFYKKIIKQNIPDKNNSILVVAGSHNDFVILRELEYKNVTISNLDERLLDDQFKPYNWSRQNAESLTFADKSFDYVIVNMGLHHCFSPHKALLEMYRVAYQGVICIENRDSFLMKMLINLNLSYKYELPAVFFNNCNYGGVQNSEIPNYIYRWKENEVKKTIDCYAPYTNHKIFYYYDLNIPERYKNKFFLKYMFTLLRIIFKTILPKQLNIFAFFIKKPNFDSDLLPWLKIEDNLLKINKNWINDNWNKKFNPR